MEQLIAEIEAYAARAGMTPSQVLRAALNTSGRTWPEWQAIAQGRGRGGGPTMVSVDRLRAWMVANPPEVSGETCAGENGSDGAARKQDQRVA